MSIVDYIFAYRLLYCFDNFFSWSFGCFDCFLDFFVFFCFFELSFFFVAGTYSGSLF
jgi:hypothetical protein